MLARVLVTGSPAAQALLPFEEHLPDQHDSTVGLNSIDHESDYRLIS